jgi:hypothetical protein
MYASRISDLFSSLQIWKDHVINWTKEEILRAHPAKGRAVIQEFNSRLARTGLSISRELAGNWERSRYDFRSREPVPGEGGVAGNASSEFFENKDQKVITIDEKKCKSLVPSGN